MNKAVFKISSDLNVLMAENAAVEVTEGQRLAIVGNSLPATIAGTLDDDVRAFLASEGLGETLDVSPEMSRLEIAGRVERWLAALHFCEEQVNELTQLRNRAVQMVEDRYDGQIEQRKRRALFMTGVLTEMARAFPYPKGSKTMKLGFGEIGKKQIGGGLVVEDEAAAMAWARANLPEAIKKTEELLKTPIKQWIESTGTAVPGCVVNEKTDKPYAKTWSR